MQLGNGLHTIVDTNSIWWYTELKGTWTHLTLVVLAMLLYLRKDGLLSEFHLDKKLVLAIRIIFVVWTELVNALNVAHMKHNILHDFQIARLVQAYEHEIRYSCFISLSSFQTHFSQMAFPRPCLGFRKDLFRQLTTDHFAVNVNLYSALYFPLFCWTH